MTTARRLAPVLLVLFASRPLRAEDPSLVSVFPMGVSRTESTEVRLIGTGLEEAEGVLYSRGTIHSEPRPKGRIGLTVQGDTPIGEGDLWVVTPAGLSNPRRFVVSDLPIVVERETKDSADSTPIVRPPVIVAGTIDTPTDLDDYPIALEEGQGVSIVFRSPSLEGTVFPETTVFSPDGELVAHDLEGQVEPALFRGEIEPTLHLVAPSKGIYHIHVHNRFYVRDEASTYRIEIRTGPRLVAAFPHVLTKGKRKRVQLYGYQLEGGEPAGAGFPAGMMRLWADIDAPTTGEADGAGGIHSDSVMLERFAYRHPGASGVLKFELVDENVTHEMETPHQSADSAQEIALGTVVAGRFLRMSEVDWYRFAAKKGQTIAFDATGERAGLNMDLDLAVHDLQGKLLTTLLEPPPTKQARKAFPVESGYDPVGTWKVPADGEYNVMIRDLRNPAGPGPERQYRLTVGLPREEVRVVAMNPDATVPRGLSLVPGGHASLQLIAIRRGGHRVPITIQAAGLLAGMTAKPVTIPAGQESVSLRLDAEANALPAAGLIRLVAETEVDGQSRSFPVIGATPIRKDKEPIVRVTDGIAAAIVGPRDKSPQPASP